MLLAHGAKFTGRDAAIPQSLHSDHLAQLYIMVDIESLVAIELTLCCNGVAGALC